MTVQDPRASPSEVGSRSVLAELLVIVETTTALQPQIESVLRACLTPEPKGVALAQKGGQLNATLAHLLDRADRLPRTWIVEEARGLLQYHHRLLAETVSRAYSVSAIFHRRPMDKFSSHLGEPAARLRRLGDLLAGYLGNERGRCLRAARRPRLATGAVQPQFTDAVNHRARERVEPPPRRCRLGPRHPGPSSKRHRGRVLPAGPGDR
jgi:hypothetical protein